MAVCYLIKTKELPLSPLEDLWHKMASSQPPKTVTDEVDHRRLRFSPNRIYTAHHTSHVQLHHRITNATKKSERWEGGWEECASKKGPAVHIFFLFLNAMFRSFTPVDFTSFSLLFLRSFAP